LYYVNLSEGADTHRLRLRFEGNLITGKIYELSRTEEDDLRDKTPAEGPLLSVYSHETDASIDLGAFFGDLVNAATVTFSQIGSQHGDVVKADVTVTFDDGKQLSGTMSAKLKADPSECFLPDSN